MKKFEALMANLATNLRFLRDKRGLTQAQIAKVAGIPRSTVAHLESGISNPTLAVLMQLGSSLQVSIEELLSSPRSEARIFPKGSLPRLTRGQGGAVDIDKLLPDDIPGMEVDRFMMKPSSRLKKTPHRAGTREYLYCEKGQITLETDRDAFVLNSGDVIAFDADQKHFYKNSGRGDAVGFSVITLSPLAASV